MAFTKIEQGAVAPGAIAESDLAIDVYTTAEVDTALGLKANQSTTYTKTEVDTSLALKANTSSLGTLASLSTIGTTNVNDGAITAAKLSSTAITDKLGYTPLIADGYYNLNTSINLNSVTTAGSYRIGQTATNLPSGSGGFGQLLVLRNPSQDTITQIYSDYASSILYTRSGNPTEVGGTGSPGWLPWKKVVMSDTSDVLTVTNLTGGKFTNTGNIFGVGGGAIRQWTGYGLLTTGFSIDISFPSNECSSLLICNHWHWGNGGYGAGRISNVSVGPNTSIIDNNIQNFATGNGGSFSFSKVNDYTIRVTKNAGTYAAGCNWHITSIGN